MACFERASPALKEILLKIHRAEKPMEIDQNMHEFGSVNYHVQCSASDPICTYLSISTPLLSQGSTFSSELPTKTLETVKNICPDVIEIVKPPKEGFQLTMKLNLAILHNKARQLETLNMKWRKLYLSDEFLLVCMSPVATKMINGISSVQAVILSSQLKEILRNIDSDQVSQGMYKPIKFTYHPRQPFFVIKQPEIITAVFPMRFKEDTDVNIATAFFQELMDVGSSRECTKAPRCIWSPIPPSELRGEPIADLCTNAGFVAFDITSRHVEGNKLDKTVWNLLNFYTFVNYHVKSTRSFIQRRMRTRLESLVQLLQHPGAEEDQQIKKKVKGHKGVRKWIRISKSKLVKRKYELKKKLKRIRSRIKIHWFSSFRRRWLRLPKFSSVRRYQRLD